MQVTVYVDMLFLVNWLMDYALLKTVASLLHLKTEKGRMAAAAAVGAVWVCVIAMFILPTWLETIGSLLLVNSAMIWIAFNPRGRRLFFRCFLVLYMSAFFGGGMLNLVYFHTGIGEHLKALIWGREETVQSVIVIPIGMGLLYLVFLTLQVIAAHRVRQRYCYEAHLFWEGRTVTLTALLDTGNQLREPITGKAVHIARKNAIEGLEPERKMAVRMLIPFHSVGTESGLLTAIRIDRMELIGSNGEQITVERPLIGLYEGKLATQGDYQLILQAEIETRQGERL